jgi:CRISPR/Cas system-associated exonuclease Cas4 (RecB family)
MIKKQGPPTRISVSQINCFSSCPLKFSFQYIKKLKPVTTSFAMGNGLKVHDLIAKNIFDHGDEDIDASLKIAKEYLENFSSDEECLTEHKLTGHICNKPTLGIYDKLFPKLATAVDWKNGKDAPYKRWGFNIQAYIYSILYEQNFDNKPLEKFDFVFFGSNTIYSPPVNTDKFKDKCQKYIENVIELAYCEDGKYPKKESPLCNYCSYQSICSIFD